MIPIAPQALEALAAAAGADAVCRDPQVIAPLLSDWRGRPPGTTPLMLRPRTTAAVARILALAQELRVPIVPQGGNTGLAGGQTPHGEVLLSLARMTAVREIDVETNTLTAEAGVTLAGVQAAAAAAGRHFPLSLAAEGTATLGGVLSTNAGGTAVLRYGTARALALGVEAVLPGGAVLRALSGLRKDNTGYALSQLLIGAEGTLGVITAATLRLFPAPQAVVTAFIAVPAPEAAVALLRRLEAACGGALSAFELVPRIGLELVLRHVPGSRLPFARMPDYAVLAEATSAAEEAPLRAQIETALAAALSAGEADDAVIAASARERADLWHLRESLSAAQKAEGVSLKHDVAVPVSRIAAFIAEARAAVAAVAPEARVVAFGHVGDGNVHFNVSAPERGDPAAFRAAEGAIADAVHAAVLRHRGSISAEHGIGRAKAALLAETKDPVALSAMRAIKQALDPYGIMNPGVLFAG